MTLEEMMKVAEAATPGPWKAEHYSTVDGIGEYNYFAAEKGTKGRVLYWQDTQYQRDRDYIATFNPEVVKRLLRLAIVAEKLADDAYHVDEELPKAVYEALEGLKG